MPTSLSFMKLALVTALLGVGYTAWEWYTRPCCAPPPLNEVVLGTLSSLTLPGARPADFALVMHHGPGAVAPAYHYDYELRIDGRGLAALTYWPGYSRDDSLRVTAQFAIDSVTLDMLWELAAPLRTAPGARDDSDIPVGGSAPSFEITSDGTTRTVVAWQPNLWHSYALALADRARTTIPDSVWARCEAAQARLRLRED